MSKIKSVIKFIEDLLQDLGVPAKEPKLSVNGGTELNDDWVKWYAYKHNVSFITARQIGMERLRKLRIDRKRGNKP